MNGIIISIEGTDGSGKHTQQQLLSKDLRELGYKVFDQSFPNYESVSAEPVKMYLSGEFGSDPNCLDAYQASVLYATDRLCTYKKNIEPHYKNGEIILFDRYVQSNLIHQSSKLPEGEERQNYVNYFFNFEHNMLKLPKPDLIFFIEMPVEKSIELARARAEYKNGETKDILEEDTTYMTNAYNNGVALAKQFNWTMVHCVDEDGNLKSIETIHAEIMEEVTKFLKSKNL